MQDLYNGTIERLHKRLSSKKNQLATQNHPYLNPIEELLEIEMFTIDINNAEAEIYFIEVSDDYIMYN